MILAMNTFNNLGFHNCDCNPKLTHLLAHYGCIEIIDETGDYSTMMSVLMTVRILSHYAQNTLNLPIQL